MLRFRSAALLCCLFAVPALPSCGIFGPPSPTLVFANEVLPSDLRIEILDSSVDPEDIYLKLQLFNDSDRLMVVDGNKFSLSTGSQEWAPKKIRKTEQKINAKNSLTLKLKYRDVDGTQPAYELICLEGGVKYDGSGGEDVTVMPIRLDVQKPPAEGPAIEGS